MRWATIALREQPVLVQRQMRLCVQAGDSAGGKVPRRDIDGLLHEISCYLAELQVSPSGLTKPSSMTAFRH